MRWHRVWETEQFIVWTCGSLCIKICSVQLYVLKISVWNKFCILFIFINSWFVNMKECLIANHVLMFETARNLRSYGVNSLIKLRIIVNNSCDDFKRFDFRWNFSSIYLGTFKVYQWKSVTVITNNLDDTLTNKSSLKHCKPIPCMHIPVELTNTLCVILFNFCTGRTK